MNDSQTERFAGTLHVIERDEVPAGSFRYGQLASVDGFDVPSHLHAVCLDCFKPKNEADNGASGFDRVLVAHFLQESWERASETARGLVESGHHVTLVKPV